MAIGLCKKHCKPKRIVKENTVDYFSDLPNEILLKILILLPAELLRYKYKYVCRRWFNLITNWILFDQASLIIQRPLCGKQHFYETRFLDIIELEFNVGMKEQYIDIRCRGRIRSWCNELLLIADGNETGYLYIFNLITKEQSCLPKCACSGSFFCGGHFRCKCGLVLAFDKFKGVYKVVHVVISQESVHCEILISECKSLSFKYSRRKMINGLSHIGERKYYWSDPVSVEGRFLHWDVHSAEYIVSMDIVDEKFRQTRLPEYSNSSLSDLYQFVEMDGLLSLLLPISATQVDIWILKDFQRTIWVKLQSIRSLSYASTKIYPGRIHPVPLACLKNGSIIIFRKTGCEFGYFAYYLKHNRMVKLEIGIEADECWLVQSKSLK